MDNLTKRFITIEGIEGVGKTTARLFIHNYLTQHKQEVVLTREPGGTAIGEELRNILLHNHQEPIHNQTELLLMFAARAQHIANIILPALKLNKWVVCDRYVDATYAYQGGGRKIALEEIEHLDRWVVNPIYPAATILLDASPSIGLARAKARSNHDRIEQEKIDFFERVRAVYLSRAIKFSNRFHVINAEQPLQKVQDELKQILDFLVTE